MTVDTKNVDETIKRCRDLLAQGDDREKALEVADTLRQFIGSVQYMAGMNFQSQGEMAYHLYSAYQIICTIYAWNDKLDEVSGLDYPFVMFRPWWYDAEKAIGDYLVMLMIKKQSKRLEDFFSDEEFKKSFLPYYEAYISMLVNPNYILTCKQSEVIPIANRILHGKKYE